MEYYLLKILVKNFQHSQVKMKSNVVSFFDPPRSNYIENTILDI